MQRPCEDAVSCRLDALSRPRAVLRLVEILVRIVWLSGRDSGGRVHTQAFCYLAQPDELSCQVGPRRKPLACPERPTSMHETRRGRGELLGVVSITRHARESPP